MKRGIISIICLLSLYVLPAKATLVIIQITAEIDDVYDPYGYLGGKIKVGDIITGMYTYDLSTLDSNPLPQGADYVYRNEPSGIFLRVGGFEFKSDPLTLDFVIEIINDHFSGGLSYIYLLISYSNLPLSNGSAVGGISWTLEDTTGKALSSDALPTTAPVLEDWGFNRLNIGGGTRARPFGFLGHVTSAEVIPEPSTILFLGLGSLILRKRRYP